MFALCKKMNFLEKNMLLLFSIRKFYAIIKMYFYVRLPEDEKRGHLSGCSICRFRHGFQ